jgi:hypothetical protein
MATTTPGRAHHESTKLAVAEGTTVFAGVMLVTLSIFAVLEGIAAIAKDDVFVHGLNYTFQFDISTWGWIHLLIGAVGIATGVGILMNQAWGFVVGILVASISAIINFGFLPYYPFWSVLIIAFDGFVIWALCTRLAAPDET